MSHIEIKNLCKFFEKKKVLQDLNLTLLKNTIYGIVGPSGAGKSTLLRCLTGLETPCSGSILFDKERHSSFQLAALRKNMGVVFQHFELFSSRSVFDNIAYPLEIRQVPLHQRQERVHELLNLVKLKEKAHCFPCHLSGGEKQRVGIARALAHKPSLLLCDEPTSALDFKTANEILALLKELNETLGLTVLMITHQIEAVKQICHRVGVLAEGKIVEEGEVKELFLRPKLKLTRQLFQLHSIEIPTELLALNNGCKKLVQLSFEGEQAKRAVISDLIKTFDVEINILEGKIEKLQQMIVGSLLIELSGAQAQVEKALCYLRSHHLLYREIL